MSKDFIPDFVAIEDALKRADGLPLSSLWGRINRSEREGRMKVLLVRIHVKPECAEAFHAATIENARCSREEPGIARFDVIRQADDPNRFVLIEAYRTPDANATHRETAHYKTWRTTVESMMAEPRVGTWHDSVSPDDEGR